MFAGAARVVVADHDSQVSWNFRSSRSVSKRLDRISSVHQSALVLELDPRDRSAVNFVWTVCEAQGAHAGKGPGETGG